MGLKLLAVEKADRIFRSLINIIVFTALAIAVSDFLFFQPLMYSAQWFNLAGLIMSVVGLSIYFKARHDLGRLFSEKLTIASNHKIVSVGIYRFVRHPIYLGGSLLLLGATLVFNSIIGFFFMLPYVGVILLRIPFEERMLIETFGQQYIEYAKRTHKLIPLIY